MPGEKCGECGYDIAACNEIAMLREALMRHAVECLGFNVAPPGVRGAFNYKCIICGAQHTGIDLHTAWHAPGCILGPRACDMMAATQVALAVDDRRIFGSGFLSVDATVPGGLHRLDPATITIRFPTTVNEGKL